MTEAQLQDGVLDTAHGLGWLSYHTYDSRKSAAGFPDLVLVRPPRLLFVELKSATGEVSLEQQVWAGQLERVSAAAPPVVGYRLWAPADYVSGAVESELRAR